MARKVASGLQGERGQTTTTAAEGRSTSGSPGREDSDLRTKFLFF
jgi:hypothetical protein